VLVLPKCVVPLRPLGVSPACSSPCPALLFAPRPCQFCLELYNPGCRGQKIKACKTDGDGKVVEGKHESYRISASSATERDQWIEAIR
jgi:cytohesin